MPICSRSFDRFDVEIWAQSDIDHIRRDEGFCIVVKTGDQRNIMEIDEDMFDNSKFVPLTDDMRSPRCYICGNGGDTMERYKFTGFTLHRKCRSDFVERVREFLDDSSEDIISKNI